MLNVKGNSVWFDKPVDRERFIEWLKIMVKTGDYKFRSFVSYVLLPIFMDNNDTIPEGLDITQTCELCGNRTVADIPLELARLWRTMNKTDLIQGSGKKINSAQAGTIAHRTPKQMALLARTGEIPAEKINGQWLFLEGVILSWIMKNGLPCHNA